VRSEKGRGGGGWKIGRGRSAAERREASSAARIHSFSISGRLSPAAGGREREKERDGEKRERERERERRGRERRKTEGLSRVASLGNERRSVRLIEDHREESSPRGYPRSPSRRRNLLVAMLHHAIDYRRFA